MLRSIAAMSLGGTLSEKLYAVAAAGFDAVELSEAELCYSDLSPAQIKELLEEVGLSVSLFHSMAGVEGVAPAVFTVSLRRLDRKFKLMTELNATLLQIPSNTSADAQDNETLAIEQLTAVAEHAKKYGIRVGYEAVTSGRFVKSYADAWHLVEAAEHSHLGLVLDSFEILACGDDPEPLASLPGDKILHVQLADAPPLSIDIETLGRHFRCFPGQGALDVPGFAANVIDSGYTGAFSLEVPSDVIRAAPNRAAALDGYRSLVFVEERLFRGGRKCPGSLFESIAPPAEQTEESIGFVEFAVDSQSHGELGSWLEHMGFVRAGEHRSKDVSLYRQGDVLLVLNAGSDTFAHYYHHLHGTSVCAIGLRLADPAAMLARAELYKYKRYEERIGAQEYQMPAVRMPDGSLIHLLDDSYDPATDFVIDDEGVAKSSVVVRIDHLARAVPEDQFDSWVLFYRALLSLESDRSLDFPDPHGVVRSQALHDAANRLRLPLTYSESSKTVVARSLSSFGGAGVNQIAFETNDIFRAVDKMRSGGVPLLTIPANYYRELGESRDVDRGLVDELKAASILYDRDDSGAQFLHVYTALFNGRFFFEIVQRDEGYTRYGECNAPVRMAAQAKHYQTRRATS